MLFADFDDFSCKFMSHDGRMRVNILGNTLMCFTQCSTFICRHANAIGNDFDKYFVIFDLRQFKFLCAQIVGSIQPDSSCFHIYRFPLLKEILSFLKSTVLEYVSVAKTHGRFSNQGADFHCW